MQKQKRMFLISISIIGSILMCFYILWYNQKEDKQEEKLDIYRCVHSSQEDDIEIFYPQVNGFEDKNKEYHINALIEKDVMKVVTEGLVHMGSDFRIDLDYEIKYINENIISIFYHGLYGNTVAGQGLSAIAMATTIDVENEKIITMKDIIVDFDELSMLLLNDEFESITIWDGMTGIGKISREYAGTEDLLIQNLQKECYDILNHYVEWYVEGENFIVISLYGSAYEEYSMDINSIKDLFNEDFLVKMRM